MCSHDTLVANDRLPWYALSHAIDPACAAAQPPDSSDSAAVSRPARSGPQTRKGRRWMQRRGSTKARHLGRDQGRQITAQRLGRAEQRKSPPPGRIEGSPALTLHMTPAHDANQKRAPARNDARSRHPPDRDAADGRRQADRAHLEASANPVRLTPQAAIRDSWIPPGRPRNQCLARTRGSPQRLFQVAPA